MRITDESYSLTNSHSGYDKNFESLDELKAELEYHGLPENLAVFSIGPDDIQEHRHGGRYVICTNHYQIWRTTVYGEIVED